MKAAVYYETGAPSVFKYEDVPDPTVHPQGVLIDVNAEAVHPALTPGGVQRLARGGRIQEGRSWK